MKQQDHGQALARGESHAGTQVDGHTMQGVEQSKGHRHQKLDPSRRPSDAAIEQASGEQGRSSGQSVLLSAGQRLRQAEKLAAEKPLTQEQALGRVPAVREQQAVVAESRRRLAHYEQQGEAHRREHPILSRLPGLSPKVTNLRTGRTERLYRSMSE